jgi:hypothetical protein
MGRHFNQANIDISSHSPEKTTIKTKGFVENSERDAQDRIQETG